MLYLIAERLGGESFGQGRQVYKFERIKRAKRALQEALGEGEFLDFGVGEPDRMADARVVEALCREARKERNRFYADSGCQEFKAAVVDFMRANFQVDLDGEREVVHTMGSKSALALLPKCFINSGDVVLETSPGYPVLGTHARELGGETYAYALLAENNFLPRLEEVPPALLKRAKLLLLNYPNNPTGGVATTAFFEEALDFAEKHQLLIVQDAAYASLTAPAEKPLSILQIAGAKTRALELHSLSKGFNMTGWRLGWACGNSWGVAALAEARSHCDSGQFLGIQRAACVALAHAEIARENAQRYARRAEAAVEVLRPLGFQATAPRAGFFLYMPSPSKARGPDGQTHHFQSAEDFSEFLLTETLTVTVPWTEAGDYIRFSMTFQAAGQEEEKAVFAKLKERLGRYSFSF